MLTNSNDQTNGMSLIYVHSHYKRSYKKETTHNKIILMISEQPHFKICMNDYVFGCSTPSVSHTTQTSPTLPINLSSLILFKLFHSKIKHRPSLTLTIFPVIPLFIWQIFKWSGTWQKKQCFTTINFC